MAHLYGVHADRDKTWFGAMAGVKRLESPSGLSVEVNANGSLRRVDHRGIMVNLFLGSEIEGGPANLYLRRHGESIESTPLLGPRSPATVDLDESGLRLRGEWRGIGFDVSLVLSRSTAALFWHVALENREQVDQTIDLIYAQDLALADYGAVRMNEYYVAQYIDFLPLEHVARGHVLAVRQNLLMAGRHPWAMIGSLERGVSFATDALQLYPPASRTEHQAPSLREPTLPGQRRQHEHSMAAIQDASTRIEPGATAHRGFFVWLEEDHPASSSTADLAFVDKALALPDATPPPASSSVTGARPVASLFSARPALAIRDLDEPEVAAHFGSDLRHVERDGETWLSFFAGVHRHVVLAAKERAVLRPHGQIIRTGDTLAPDEESLTSTTWMAGVFHSQVTQGHVNINRFLSTTRSYLGFQRSAGVRIFVELEDGYRLLALPSAYEMTPGSARWLYRYAGGLFEVNSWAATSDHVLGLSVEVREGPPCRFLLSSHVALGGDDGVNPSPVRFTRDAQGIQFHAVPDTDVGRRFPQGFFRIDPVSATALEQVGGDELLFVDGGSRSLPFLCMVTAPTKTASFRLTGGLLGATPSPAARSALHDAAQEERHWRTRSGRAALSAPRESELAQRADGIEQILPWFAHDALIHFLAPRGLEQFSGGGWGTRDVCQGPVELLHALGEWVALRDLLLMVFKNQNPDGDWPQWFMFFDRERGIRPDDSHGDIVFWPVLALAQYVLASGDATILDQVVPFFHPEGDARAESATVLAHVERALGVMGTRVIPRTRLAAYGHGDWNDSLQPADPSLRERLCSVWTVTLHFQTMTTMAEALRCVGRSEAAARFDGLAAAIRADFQRLLIPGGTLAGFAHFEDDGTVSYLLHPSDRQTGIHYRLLPMIHAIINDLLTPEQAKHHVETMRAHLLGADGARLFDRPPEYRGGLQKLFQRAESSSFFGREIGIMYTHAHLRYGEAMARYGDAEAFFLALCQAIPIALPETVPAALLRQANCYTSSSDAAVADRYEAQSRYPDVRAGKIAFEGGWRVYSSGAGIAFRLIHERFLGLRRARTRVTIDPVIPARLHGLAAEVELAGAPLRILYRIQREGCGPTGLCLNGRELPFEREPNPYRPGGAVVSLAAMRELSAASGNELVVDLA